MTITRPLTRAITSALTRPITEPGTGAWTPDLWFLASEQGIWLDPSDMSVMFQDSAGTIPVTAVEQPVGKILDKSGRGNHATQATAASRPVLSARKNLLLATTTLATQNVTTVATPYTLSHTGTGTITLSGTSTAGPLVGAGTLTFTPTAGTLTMTVSGTVSNAQLEYGSAATTYQRVTTATDYDTVGFPHYLKFDGVDDSLSTAAIDFTATDKMTVMAGVRKNIDAESGVIVETGTNRTIAGCFGVRGPAGASATYDIGATGTTGTGVNTTPANFAAPITSVISASFDISKLAYLGIGPIRINGVQQANGFSGAGVTTIGTFASASLQIGRLNAGILPFNGNLNQLVVRGAATADLTPGESYVASKTGVTL